MEGLGISGGASWRPWARPDGFIFLVRSLVARTSVLIESLALHHTRLLKLEICWDKMSHHERKPDWPAGAAAAGKDTFVKLFGAGRALEMGESHPLLGIGDGSILSLLSAAILVPGLDEGGLEIPKVGGNTETDQVLPPGDEDDGSVDDDGKAATTHDLFLACISGRKALQDGCIKEPTTGVAFPAMLCRDSDGGSCNLLAGVGVRSKSIIKVKSITVYAFGLYVKPDNVKKVLGPKYGGIAPDVLKFRPEFYEDLLTNELDMTVRLVVHYRGLNMDMVRNAFKTSLTNRLAKIGGSEEDGLRDFTGYFTNDKKLRRGTTIDFRWQPGGRFHTQIDGNKLGTLVSPRLCQAFFDLYIGEPPVSTRAKHEIGESFARMLVGC